MIEFNKWFEREQLKGLVDIKLTIDLSPSINVESVKNELLATELMIENGQVTTAPLPKNSLPLHIKKTVDLICFN
jgi:hypothetical protein